MKRQWLYDIPAELRETVYESLFTSMSVDFASNRRKRPVDINRTTPLNLFLSARRVKEEAEPMFWRLASFTYRCGGAPEERVPRVEHMLPAPHHFRYIQSLTIEGNLLTRDVEALVKLGIDPMEVGIEKRMQLLKVNNYMHRICGYKSICRTIERCIGRVSRLELRITFSTHREVLSKLDPRDEEDPGFGFFDDDPCWLTFQDTYNVTMDNTNFYVISDIEEMLQVIYLEDYEKLKMCIIDPNSGEKSWPVLQRHFVDEEDAINCGRGFRDN